MTLDTDAIKKDLEAKLKALIEKADELEGSLREPVSQDSEEQAMEMEGDQVTEGLERAALHEIDGIKATLARIEDGSYGICTKCDEPIPEPRLKAYPTAALCVNCASGAAS
ncbi:MAG: TraR/DksA C4-type zinc finger protein [Rhodospirillales bacterium]